jgi:TolB protein
MGKNRYEGGGGVYEVEKHQHLLNELRWSLPLQSLIQANNLAVPYLIFSDHQLSKLVIPAGVPFYAVRQGDTPYKIAAKYNVAVNGQVRPDL